MRARALPRAPVPARPPLRPCRPGLPAPREPGEPLVPIGCPVPAPVLALPCLCTRAAAPDNALAPGGAPGPCAPRRAAAAAARPPWPSSLCGIHAQPCGGDRKRPRAGAPGASLRSGASAAARPCMHGAGRARADTRRAAARAQTSPRPSTRRPRRATRSWRASWSASRASWRVRPPPRRAAPGDAPPARARAGAAAALAASGLERDAAPVHLHAGKLGSLYSSRSEA